jgi:hypothetical protein
VTLNRKRINIIKFKMKNVPELNFNNGANVLARTVLDFGIMPNACTKKTLQGYVNELHTKLVCRM